MKIKSTFHNELLGMFAINEVISHLESISHAQVLLVLPLVFHKETVTYLTNNEVNTINALVQKKGTLAANFNQRYYSLLPASVNAVIIGQSLGYFTVIDEKIVSTKRIDNDRNLGVRIDQIKVVAPKVASFFNNTSTTRIYSALKLAI